MASAPPVSAPPDRPSLGTILIADDKDENLLLLTSYLSRKGYATLSARNGQEAVRACQAAIPDLIIMDAAMPEMDGFEATREIRRLYPDKWIPILFLSAYDSNEHQARGLGAGGDDYLTKPVNLAILSEKIKAMRRIAEAQERVARYAAQLESAIEQARTEQEFAQHLLQRIIHKGLDVSDGVQQWVRAAEHFSGDVIVTARGPGGELYVLLADATGHGLAAAISVLPVIEAFYRLAEKGFSVASIVAELNRKTRELMPRDRFIAAAVALIDHGQRSLQIWNGGIPTARFLDDAGRTLRDWPSTHPPLGILAEGELDARPDIFSWPSAGQLVMHSDGLIEAVDQAGATFGSARVSQLLAGTGRDARFAAVVSAVQAHIGQGSTHDDISLVTVACPDDVPATARSAPDPSGSAAANGFSSWHLSLGLDAAQLRTLDVVPLLMSWLDQLHLNEQHRRTAFVVLAELVNNALDHGLLRLDSGIKQQPDGFERYIRLRTERLAHLESGSLRLSIAHLELDGAPCLKISVRDSGPGFAHEELLQQLGAAHTLPSGRGILLVKSIAAELRYEGAGNVAVALLRLPGAAPAVE
jgi:CheY-like chemotaxis protein